MGWYKFLSYSISGKPISVWAVSINLFISYSFCLTWIFLSINFYYNNFLNFLFFLKEDPSTRSWCTHSYFECTTAWFSLFILTPNSKRWGSLDHFLFSTSPPLFSLAPLTLFLLLDFHSFFSFFLTIFYLFYRENSYLWALRTRVEFNYLKL